MSELKDIDTLSRLVKLLEVMGRVSRISYLADKSKQRYPSLEMMTTEEMEALTKMYLALGFDFEDAYLEWKKLYEEFTGRKPRTTK